MAYHVDVTEPAKAEIYQATAFIAQFAPDAADRWLAGISRSIRSLARMPRRCPLAPESGEAGIELRQLLYGKRSGIYRIIFRIVEPDRVEVIAVRHGARDLMRPSQ